MCPEKGVHINLAENRQLLYARVTKISKSHQKALVTMQCCNETNAHERRNGIRFTVL